MKFEELLLREHDNGEIAGTAIGEKKMADLITFLLRDGLETEIPNIAADENLRKNYYQKYNL